MGKQILKNATNTALGIHKMKKERPLLQQSLLSGISYPNWEDASFSREIIFYFEHATILNDKYGLGVQRPLY